MVATVMIGMLVIEIMVAVGVGGFTQICKNLTWNAVYAIYNGLV